MWSWFIQVNESVTYSREENVATFVGDDGSFEARDYAKV